MTTVSAPNISNETIYGVYGQSTQASDKFYLPVSYSFLQSMSYIATGWKRKRMQTLETSLLAITEELSAQKRQTVDERDSSNGYKKHVYAF